MQGMTHWRHPHFFAYFPSACSYPAIIGDILSSGLASVGFTWVRFFLMPYLKNALEIEPLHD